MTLALMVASVLLPTASANAREESPEPSPVAQDADAGRETRRLVIGLAGVMFASYPRSIEDPGPALVLGKPLWLGARHQFFQWVLDAEVLAGFGTASRHAHLAVAPQFGFNLYLGSVFGFELRFGPTAILQAGHRTVVGLGLSGGGGYVFRFFEDDRRRLKLLVLMHVGGYFASDPGNDIGANASAMGIGLAYEAAF